ncbi:MAG TPA: hypothetical protein VHD87_14970 [Acidimicrobiales bacterium]|nr:hypothetical protein [Acidimicrobiales bacterium]
MKKRLVMALVGVLAAVPAFVAPAKADGKGWVPAYTPIYRCNWRGCPVDRVTQVDAWMYFTCYADSPYNPVGERFFKVPGGVGFIQASRVYSQPSLPKC